MLPAPTTASARDRPRSTTHVPDYSPAPVIHMHKHCAQSDWMMGQCARDARLRLDPSHGCTCVRWDEHTEGNVRARLSAGSCSFFQFPNSPGSPGGPFKDLMSLLRGAAQPGPAIVHQLYRLV